MNADFFRKTREPVEQITLDAAIAMNHEAEAYARRIGHRISVAIVDGCGVPIALSRMDGASARTAELALNKAYTATVYNIATDANRQAHRSLTVLSRGKIMAGAGGIAIMGAFGAVTLGAIGVAGGQQRGSRRAALRPGRRDGPGPSPLTRGSQSHPCNWPCCRTRNAASRRAMPNISPRVQKLRSAIQRSPALTLYSTCAIALRSCACPSSVKTTSVINRRC